jgi:hypothetical protein
MQIIGNERIRSYLGRSSATAGVHFAPKQQDHINSKDRDAVDEGLKGKASVMKKEIEVSNDLLRYIRPLEV